MCVFKSERPHRMVSTGGPSVCFCLPRHDSAFFILSIKINTSENPVLNEFLQRGFFSPVAIKLAGSELIHTALSNGFNNLLVQINPDISIVLILK